MGRRKTIHACEYRFPKQGGGGGVGGGRGGGGGGGVLRVVGKIATSQRGWLTSPKRKLQVLFDVKNIARRKGRARDLGQGNGGS